MTIYYSFKHTCSQDFISQALQQYCARHNITCPKSINITKSKSGKPLANISGVHFSLTHTKDLMAIAIQDREVGIDAEWIREVDFQPILAKFNASEQLESSLAFLEWWTKKEAQAKLLDIPLASSLRLNDPLAIFDTIKELDTYIITLAYYGKPVQPILLEVT